MPSSEQILSKSGLKNQDKLKGILFKLQTDLEAFQKDVDQSYEAVKLDMHTELSKRIEAALEDPFAGIVEASEAVDFQLKSIINVLVRSFLISRKSIVHSAYRSNTTRSDLHYSIVLKRDTFENREEIFKFFERYDSIDISMRYRVFFQFVPVELETNITASDKLPLD